MPSQSVSHHTQDPLDRILNQVTVKQVSYRANSTDPASIELQIGADLYHSEFSHETSTTSHLKAFLSEVLHSLLQNHFVDRSDLLQRLHHIDLNQIQCNNDQAIPHQIQAILSQLLHQLHTPKPLTTQTEAQLFPDNGSKEITAIASAVMMVSSTRSQLRPDLWGTTEDGIAVFNHKARSNTANFVEHYISSPGDVTLLPWEQAEHIINRFGFNTVKLQLVLAAHTMQQDRPWESQFSIRGTDVIRDLGWDRRRDIPIANKLNEIAKAAFTLDCLLVKSVWVEGRHSKGGLDVSVPISRLWSIEIALRGQLDIEGNVNEPEEVILTVRPGLWTQHCLNRAGAEGRHALYQFGYLAREVLRIDPYHNELALRLAIHLTLESRVRPKGTYQVQTLLEGLLPTPEIEAALDDRFKARNLRKRWDNALNLLTELNWQLSYHPSYLEEWRPGSSDTARPGYFRELLKARLSIQPPEPIPTLISKNRPITASMISGTPALEDPCLPQPQISRQALKQARVSAGISQQALASHLGSNKSWISMLETGKRTLKPTTAREILDAIDALRAQT